MSKQICMIEIGSSKVIALVAYKGNNGLEIKGMGTCGYSCGYEYDHKRRCVTRVPDEKELTNAIRRACDQAEHDCDHRILSAYVAVNAPFLKVEVYRGERTARGRNRTVVEEDDTLLGAISLQSTDREGYVYIHSTAVCYYLDGLECLDLPIGSSIENTLAADLSHVFLDKNMANLIDRCLSSIGIKRKDFVAVPLAEANYLIPNARAEEEAVLIDAGYRHIDVSFVRNEAVTDIEIIPVGGQIFASDVEIVMDIPPSNAEMIKKRFNFATDYTGAKETIKNFDGSIKYVDMAMCSEVIRSRAEELSDIILDILNRHGIDFDETDVYITGGGFMMENCIKSMAERMNIRVVQSFPPISRERLNTPNNISAFAAAAFVADLMYDDGEPEEYEEKPRRSIFDKLFKK